MTAPRAGGHASRICWGVRSGTTRKPAFGGLAVPLLAQCLLLIPALTATSVDGDRERGLLAPLRVAGGGAVLVTVRRLRTPARTLPEGVRVA